MIIARRRIALIQLQAAIIVTRLPHVISQEASDERRKIVLGKVSFGSVVSEDVHILGVDGYDGALLSMGAVLAKY